MAKRLWALDADLAAAFDKISHDHLLSAIGSFPARDMIREWLKAGVFEPGKGFAPTGEGTPQGGVISPLLMNVALHGLEKAAGVRYHTAGVHVYDTTPGSLSWLGTLTTWSCSATAREQARTGQVRGLAVWLTPRVLLQRG
jgi:RNA-directed DNA polymerase